MRGSDSHSYKIGFHVGNKTLTICANVPSQHVVQATSQTSPGGEGHLHQEGWGGSRAHGRAQTDDESTENELWQMEACGLQDRARDDTRCTAEHAGSTAPSIHDIATNETPEDVANGVDREDCAVQLARLSNLEPGLEWNHGIDGTHD